MAETDTPEILNEKPVEQDLEGSSIDVVHNAKR